MISFRIKSATEEAVLSERNGIIVIDLMPSVIGDMPLEAASQKDGIIVIDLMPGVMERLEVGEKPAPFQLSARVERLDLEFSQSRMALVNIDQTPLTPHVFEDTTGFNFDPAKQQLDILDREGGPALTVDTSRDTALISVNFKTSTITAYVEAQNAAPGTNDPMTSS
jgi:hypothetical protein